MSITATAPRAPVRRAVWLLVWRAVWLLGWQGGALPDELVEGARAHPDGERRNGGGGPPLGVVEQAVRLRVPLHATTLGRVPPI
ncbi:MAG: hypothetical protein M3P93_12150, partial [Actinomycetota bacterium]|nr:hypothetical protein [Actinomycetota bacterium]